MRSSLLYSVITIALFLSQLTFAQKLTSESLKKIQLDSHKKILTQALKYNDPQTAINSMHFIISLEGETSNYKDSLAITYFRTGNYISSHLLAKELLGSNPGNSQLLEINAISLEKLSATKDAIAAYEILFANTRNMAHGYRLAVLQYGIKRLAEAQVTIVQTLQCEEIENAFIQFPIDDNKNQNVPLKVASLNLQGLIAYGLKDNNEAIVAFQEALKLMPEFTAANQNANVINVALNSKAKLDKKE